MYKKVTSGYSLGCAILSPNARLPIARFEMLEKAIDNLPVAFRVVFLMRDVEGISIGGTAKLLAIREETVKTRLHRALRMLRDSLGGQLASSLKDVFPFDKPRCDALVQRLLDQLGFSRTIYYEDGERVSSTLIDATRAPARLHNARRSKGTFYGACEAQGCLA